MKKRRGSGHKQGSVRSTRSGRIGRLGSFASLGAGADSRYQRPLQAGQHHQESDNCYSKQVSDIKSGIG